MTVSLEEQRCRTNADAPNRSVREKDGFYSPLLPEDRSRKGLWMLLWWYMRACQIGRRELERGGIGEGNLQGILARVESPSHGICRSNSSKGLELITRGEKWFLSVGGRSPSGFCGGEKEKETRCREKCTVLLENSWGKNNRWMPLIWHAMVEKRKAVRPFIKNTIGILATSQCRH